MPYGKVNYDKIMRLAEEQSVVGLVTAGLELVKDAIIPKEVLLQFIGQTVIIEHRNKEMNAFVADLVSRMRSHDIYSLLVKGQGIAQCYERPIWRSCGDVDLFLSEDNYHKAEAYLSSICSRDCEKDDYCKHHPYKVDTWEVELHGTLRSGLWKRLDSILDQCQRAVFYGGNVRSWMNGKTMVFLPAADEDVVFVFSHILQHYFKEGIGLRQICDWCRLLWTYKESIDTILLEKRLYAMGVMSEWKTFAALAVDYLGIPVKVMPYYSESHKWSRKAQKVMTFILETGNFGHNRDTSYLRDASLLVRKIKTLWRLTKNISAHTLVFPIDSVRVWVNMFILRMKVAISKVDL